MLAHSPLWTGLFILAALAGRALAHIESKFGPTFNQQSQVPFAMTSPLNLDGSDFPCKGLAGQIATTAPVATFLAGKTVPVTLAGTATHDGGSCQWGLSYDQGKTFAVTHSVMGGCPLALKYDVTIPAEAPAADKAVFWWSWHNRVGNREMYQNCAVVRIKSSAKKPWTAPSAFIANVKGPTDCRTVEGEDPVYPNTAGSVVEFGAGLSASSPKTILKPCSVNQTTFITVSADGKTVTKGGQPSAPDSSPDASPPPPSMAAPTSTRRSSTSRASTRTRSVKPASPTSADRTVTVTRTVIVEVTETVQARMRRHARFGTGSRRLA